MDETQTLTIANIQQLRFNLARCFQNGQTITAYFRALKQIWDELFKYTSLPYCSCNHCKCGTDERLIKEREDGKTLQFLTGLDDVYAAVRSNLLAQHPLPPLNRVYELLVQEERQQRRHLPEDLLSEILSRLPVKSLMRLRCVCKSWLSLVNDANFAHLYLNTFKSNRDETRLFVVQSELEVVRRSDTFEHVSGSEELSRYMDDIQQVVSSTDGLILLRSWCRINHLKILKLWNPSLKKFRHVPPLPLGDDSSEIGLGYDPLSKDYKIVSLVSINKTWRRCVAIYSVRAGSWKIIPFQGNGKPSSWWRLKPLAFGNVCVKGSLYFTTDDNYNNGVGDLVSFDLNKEVFSVVDPCNFVLPRKLGLIDSGSSVAVFDGRWYSQGSVWVLDSETMYWKKRCPYPAGAHKLLYYKKNSDLLTFGFDRKEDCTEVVSYSLEEPVVKIFRQKRGGYSEWITRVSAYVESLVLLNDNNYKSNRKTYY